LSEQPYFEGDIKLSENIPDGVKPSAVLDNKIWPTKKIPYVISSVFSMIVELSHYYSLFFTSSSLYFLMISATSEVNLILDAMRAFKNKTCIEFIPRKAEEDYIDIQKDDG